MSNASPKTAGYVTIRYIVMSILNRRKDYTMRDYKHIAQLVIEGFTTLNMFHLPNIEVVYLYMSSDKRVDVPLDFVDWLKVGVPINGKLRTLTKDDKILFPRKFADGKDVGNADAVNVNQMVFFTDHFKNGSYVGGLYGMRGGVNTAYYRYDAESRQFVFTGNIPRGEVVLEYISSGVNLSGSTVIPRVAHMPLVSYVEWVDAENDRKLTLGEKERKKRNHFEDVEEARSFVSTPTISEYKDSLYRSSKQTAKR